MPLSPKVKKLVEKIYSQRTIPISSITIEEARALAANSKILSGKPEAIANIEDISIPGNSEDIPIRIYTPENAKPPYSALIYFFSGGFVWGSIEASDTICRAMANSAQCQVFSVGYRLAPEYKYPAGVNDAYSVVKWIFNNTNQLNISSKKISISGYSAGGNLAALATIKARNLGLKIDKQILVCPCLDLSCSMPSQKTYGNGYLLDADRMAWFMQQYLPIDTNPKDPAISPLWEKNLSDLPKTLIIAAEFDPLRDEDELFAKNLKAAGIDITYSCYQGMTHHLMAHRGEIEPEYDPIKEIGIFLKK